MNLLAGASAAVASAAASAQGAGARGKWMRASSAAPYDPFAVLPASKRKVATALDEDDDGEAGGESQAVTEDSEDANDGEIASSVSSRKISKKHGSKPSKKHAPQQ